jgi:hypothetical protein
MRCTTRRGSGPAKQLQREHQEISADLAVIIAAAIPDLAEQWAAGVGPPPAEPTTWPWSTAAIKARLAEAHALLESTGGRQTSAEKTARGKPMNTIDWLDKM